MPLRITSTPAPSLVAADPIEGWLSALMAVMRMPEREKKEIRDELESHLRERVRDLLVEGSDEAAAARRALAELGEAGALAERFRDARKTPRRRMVMNIAVIGVACAALGISVAALKGGPDEAKKGSGDLRIAEYLMLAHPDGALKLKVQLEGKGDGVQLQEMFKFLADSAKSKLNVRWTALEAVGIARDTGVSVEKTETDLPGAFAAINEAMNSGPQSGAQLEFRLVDGTLEIATRDFFDKRESKLVRYDIEELLTRVGEQDFRELITQFVEPESWMDNGGDKANMKIVGGRLFLKAPPRMIEGVAWFIEQLSEKKKVDAGNGGPGVGANGAGQAGDGKVPVLGDIPIINQFYKTKQGAAADEKAVERVILAHTAAGEVSTAMKDLAPATVVMADHQSNSVIVSGMREPVDHAAAVIRLLDEWTGKAEDRARERVQKGAALEIELPRLGRSELGEPLLVNLPVRRFQPGELEFHPTFRKADEPNP